MSWPALLGVIFWGLVAPLGSDAQRLDADHAFVATLAGSGYAGRHDGLRDGAQFNWPTGVAVGPHGILYIADYRNNLIRPVTPMGTVTTLAGNGDPGWSDGRGRAARLHGPDSLAIDEHGVLYVADADNARIRRVAGDGTVTTVAGSGARGYADGKGSGAMFVYPTGIAVSRDGLLYIADRGAHRIRKVSHDGMVSTVAGNGTPGWADGPGPSAQFHDPMEVAVDRNGNVYVADSGTNTIRKIATDGTVTTVAGDGRAQPAYQDGRGKAARFSWPTGIAVAPDGALFVSDSNNARIRRVGPDGTVTTVAGSGIAGFRNGAAATGRFNFPTGIEVDSQGHLYVADSANNMIRKIMAVEMQAVHQPGIAGIE